jgi:hypothetical protein
LIKTIQRHRQFRNVQAPLNGLIALAETAVLIKPTTSPPVLARISALCIQCTINNAMFDSGEITTTGFGMLEF